MLLNEVEKVLEANNKLKHVCKFCNEGQRKDHHCRECGKHLGHHDNGKPLPYRCWGGVSAG